MRSRALPQGFARVPQGGGDLGDRMARMMRRMPPGPVCVIGADIPGIDRAAIWQAFRVLGRHDAVFGPAPDGGFWLVGMKRCGALPARLFDGVRWSTRHALADSVASVGHASIGYAATLQDVDTLADLQALDNRP